MNRRERDVVIYFHGNDWDGVPGRQRLLMEALAEHLDVIFLDGGRDGWLRLNSRIPRDGVVVLRGLAVILNSFARRGWHWLARLTARWVLSRYLRGAQRVIFWGAENLVGLQRFVPHHVWIHDSIDPCLHPAEVAACEAREDSVVRGADLVFCTARVLLERALTLNARSFLLPNACVGLTPRVVASDPLKGPTLQGRSGPFVCCIGTVDARLDLGLLHHIARELPEFTLLMVGPILVELKSAVAELQNLPNVIFTGSKFGAEADALVGASSVCIIPFRRCPASDALNPVKLYTCLAAGKPVVVPDTRECLQYADIVEVCSTPDQWVAAIRGAIFGDQSSRIQRGLEFAAANTWRTRAETALAILNEAGVLRPAESVMDFSNESAPRRPLNARRHRIVPQEIRGTATPVSLGDSEK